MNLLMLACLACAPLSRRVPVPAWSPDLPAPRLEADSSTVDTIARGVLHRAWMVRSGPWAIHMLDVDRRECWSPVVVKGAEGSVGRTRSSELARDLAARTIGLVGRPPVAGAVNGDFFLFTPPGVPVSAHVENGELLAGPGDRPVFAVDSSARFYIGTLRVEGVARSGPESIPLDSWNRHARGGVAFFDPRYGAVVDSAAGSVRVVLQTSAGGKVVATDTSGGATTIPRDGSVLEVGRDAPADVRARVLLLARTRERFDVTVVLAPVRPWQAVGGFPILVRDSTEVAGLDSAGAATFAPVRHPRTLVALAAGGRRIMLITVDGRQEGYSAGMTLREAARLVRALGATQAINLDGGGSTTLVAARRDSVAYRYDVMNRPSDATGERPVGNALAIVSRCGR